MFNPKTARSGDFLCYVLDEKKFNPVGWFIGLFTVDAKRIQGKFVHIACYVGQVGQKFYKIEHHVGTDIQEVEFPVEDFAKVRVLRYPFKQSEIAILLDSARALIGLSKYDGLSFPSMSIRSSLAKALRWKWLRRTAPLFNDPTKMVCSSLWTTLAFHKLHVEMFKLDVHWASVIPEDYAGNRRMKLVS